MNEVANNITNEVSTQLMLYLAIPYAIAILIIPFWWGIVKPDGSVINKYYRVINLAIYVAFAFGLYYIVPEEETLAIRDIPTLLMTIIVVGGATEIIKHWRKKKSS